MRIVAAENAPKSVGPYSQALVAAGFVFLSGQIGIDPATGKMVEGGVAAEAKQVLANIQTLLVAAGSDKGRVVKSTVFLADMADFATMNPLYAEFFAGHAPCRSTVQVAALPLGARIEIECLALAGEK